MDIIIVNIISSNYDYWKFILFKTIERYSNQKIRINAIIITRKKYNNRLYLYFIDKNK